MNPWICVFVAVLVSPTVAQQDRAERKRVAKILQSDPAAALRMARMDGEYRMLLRQIRVREPGRKHLIERGYSKRGSYRGHRDLPAGHWVYSRPYWFIWRDKGRQRLANRRWGPEQSIGKPNSKLGHDAETAWATKLENNPKPEWLMVEYAVPVKATVVRIHETFNPGAIRMVSIFKPDGEELEVWRAKKVAPTGKKSRVLEVQLPLGFLVSRVKVHLATAKVPGWNEIDAVGLVDDKARVHWATAATASTTYAKPRSKVQPIAIAGPELALPGLVVPGGLVIPNPQQELRDKIEKLAAENRRLKQRLERLEKLVEKLQARRGK